MKKTTAQSFAPTIAVPLLAAALIGFGCQKGSEESPPPANTVAAAPPTAAAPATAVPAAAPGAAASTRPARLFVTNYQDESLSVIDVQAEREIKTIPIPDAPEGLALSPASPPLLAVANSTASNITLVDPVGLEVLGTIPCGKGPDDVAFSKDGKLLFVTSAVESTVYVLDVEKRSTIEVMPKFVSRPVRLEVSADGTRLFVLAKSAEGEVVAVDTTTRAIVGRAPAGVNPTDLTISGDGKWVITAGFDKSMISVINAATMEVVRTFQADSGFGILAHPTKPIVYSMASFSDEVYVLDYEKGEALAVLELGNYPTFSAISPDGKYLYVVHEESDNVVKVDTETNERVIRIAVGDEPSEGAYFTMP